MQDTDWNELAGRIEGVSRLVLNLTAALEDIGIIDGPRLSATLRECGLKQAGVGHLQVAERTLGELAQALDDARSWRRSGLLPC